MFRPGLCFMFAATLLFAQRSSTPTLKSLYEGRKWTDLQDALEETRGYDLYRGAVAVTFHRNPEQAESYLRAVIKAAPKSEEAFEAYEWLSHLFLYSGQYERLVSTMEARWSAFAGRPGLEQERNVIAGFRGLPDQVTVNVKPATLKHEDHGIFIPLSVNGKAASFFIDTGSWPNAISQSEATRLGLRFTQALGFTATMTNQSSFRTAVADELTVAGVRLRNVSFTVFADNSEPWSLLPPGRRGLLGMPVILAFRTVRWAHDGTVQIGQKPAPFDAHKSNLMFDNDHLAIALDVEGRTTVGAVDTGAESTDLYHAFAVQFPSSMKSGTEGTTQVRGVGGAESYQSITLPEITFEIGRSRATLRHTAVLMNRSVRSYIGNFGLDVFEQCRAFKLDFTAMTLELETKQ